MLSDTLPNAARLRRLGYGEARMHYMHSLFLGTTQGALAIRVHGPLDLDALARAARVVQARHALLGVVIVEDDDLFFARPTAISPRLEIKPRRWDGEWLDEMQHGNHVLLDTRSHLWRLVVLAPGRGEPPVFDLVLFMHHAVMDASGADTFFDELLALTAAGAGSEDAQVPDEVPPAAEACCSVNCSWDRFLQIQQQLAKETLAVAPPPHRAEAPLSERRTVVAPMRLGSDQMGAVARSVDAAGVTFNSYVSAALLAAVRRQSPDRDRFALYTALSLRRLCDGIKESDFGCYLSVLPTFHHLKAPSISLGDLADEHQRSLQKSFLVYGRPPADHDTRALRESMKRLLEIRTFVGDIAFTYAESRLRPSYGPLRVSHAYVAANRTIGNVAVVLHGLKLNNEVFFTVSHTEPLQEGRWAAQVREELAGLLGATAP